MADLVACKLDAPSQGAFELVNHPAKGINIGAVIDAIKDFKNHYKGKLALQVMLMEENKALSECKKPIFFLFMVKCPVVARDVKCRLGDVILMHKKKR
ncbi:MAG: hypothetical protein WC592_03060 [Candidatus Omnitrophota bacterium]